MDSPGSILASPLSKGKSHGNEVGVNSFIAGFQCHAIQNKNQNHSIDEVQILRKERR